MRTYPYLQISTESGRELQLENAPGVYAWFRDIDLRSKSTSEAALLAEIDRLLNANLSETFSAYAGYLYEMEVRERARGLSPHKRRQLEALSESVHGRQLLASSLQSAAEFQSPVYIGKAIKLRDRIRSHVSGESGLSARLRAANIHLEKCKLKVVYLGGDWSEEALEATGLSADALVLLLEDLLTRLAPAAFVRRPG